MDDNLQVEPAVLAHPKPKRKSRLRGQIIILLKEWDMKMNLKKMEDISDEMLAVEYDKIEDEMRKKIEDKILSMLEFITQQRLLVWLEEEILKILEKY